MAITKASLIDLNGQELILDADADTSITADTDDRIDFKTGGSDRVHITSAGHLSTGATSITNGGGYNKVIQVSGSEGCFSAISSSGEGLFAQNGANTQVINRCNGYMEFRTNNVVHQKIDSTGAVTKPLQPAFSVKRDAYQSNIATGGVIVVWQTEIFDQNSDFASNTFTAPITGKYQFNVTMRLQSIDSAAAYYQTHLQTSNRNYEIDLLDPTEFNGDLQFYTIQGSILADMDANDTAYISIYQSGGTAQSDVSYDTDTHWSGFLVC